jgi:hypothetical protein
MDTAANTKDLTGKAVNAQPEIIHLDRASGNSEEQQPRRVTKPRTQIRNPTYILPNITRQSPSNPCWLFAWAILATFLVSLLYEVSFVGNAGLGLVGAQAHTVRPRDQAKQNIKREDTPTDVCSRWSHQSAVVNDTLYLYGGRSRQTAGQEENTWNNDFLSLPLSESWSISSPKLKGLPRPVGLPPVSNGYLWHSYDALYLYGGEYSETPFEEFGPFTLWEYDIKSSSWREHASPKTSAGNNSAGGNQPVQRVGEGAGITVPELGRGWYFGGHYDHYTTPGWSLQVPRLYLKSLMEYTFPGYGNDGVESLSGGKTAGEDGMWRNVTGGGIQNSNAFPPRADGVLVHVPGFGQSGILLSLAGGNNETFVRWLGFKSYKFTAVTDDGYLIVSVECDRCLRHCDLNLVQTGN